MKKGDASKRWSGQDWSEFLLDFEVPTYNSRVFAIGCFARYVTLYSQQVRALNLIRALLATAVIARGKKLAVIGAGASGLTAAAAAAVKGVNVTVMEELEGILEIQQNNRQRWIHPHIFDWP
ncbi:MAG: NAD(P)-binding protein, partial [Verrucomicrobia bacterium]|nr:NAD(P)-binding protein [Verrucomicrobiota bacterium]